MERRIDPQMFYRRLLLPDWEKHVKEMKKSGEQSLNFEEWLDIIQMFEDE